MFIDFVFSSNNKTIGNGNAGKVLISLKGKASKKKNPNKHFNSGYSFNAAKIIIIIINNRFACGEGSYIMWCLSCASASTNSGILC